jgi:hypothetical protein
MAQTVAERIRAALTASGEELWKLVRAPHPDVLANAVLNRNLTEEMAVSIARNRAAAPETMGFLAADVRFKKCGELKAAVCRNSKTPPRITLSLLKFLRIFDLADISRDLRMPVDTRRKIEFILAEKIPSMPSGVKIALAKRVGGATLLTLMEKGDERVITACLESPLLTEAHLCRLAGRPTTKAAVIRLIALNARWSLRYNVRFALIRNYFTPMSAVLEFIRGTKAADLRELYADPKVPASTRPFLFNELQQRGEDTAVGEEKVFDLSEDEDAGFSGSGA